MKNVNKLLQCLITILCVISFIESKAQMIDELPHDENGLLNYNEVVQMDSAKKDDLFMTSKQAFVDLFRSAKDVIQLEDNENGVIVGKGLSEFYIKIMGVDNGPYELLYSIKIQSKDGKYRYEIYDFHISYLTGRSKVTSTAEEFFDKNTYYKSNGDPKTGQEKYKNAVVDTVNNLVKMIKQSMEKGVKSNSKKNDW